MTEPANPTKNTNPASLKKDLVASIVVFLVALPLCIGIAVACGVPASTGLITGIIGGTIVGLFAGSPLQVSGPAAGLVVIIVGILDKYEAKFADAEDPLMSAIMVLGCIVFFAGIVQIAAGFLKLGQWFRAVSPAVIQGMLAGIGVIIFAKMFHVMVDREAPGGVIEAIIEIPVALWDGIHVWDFNKHHQAGAIGLLTIITIILWPMLAPKKLRIIPGALVGVVLASVVAAVGNAVWGVFGEIPSVAFEGTIIDAIILPDFAAVTYDGFVVSVITIALVASAETLLCANAVDQMHTGPRTRYDQELKAQGVGNMLCGLVGGLPMTGVIVRSSANVEAGATSRWSAVMHGVWLLVFVAIIPGVLTYIPISTLAGVLVYTGYKLVNINNIKKLREAGWGELGIYIATVVGVVAIDLLSGVIIGIVLSFAKLLYTFSHLEIRREERDGSTYLFLDGTATVIALPRLAAALEKIEPGTDLHVDFEHLKYIDHACLELIVNWQKQHDKMGGRLTIDWESLNARFRENKPLRTKGSPASADADSTPPRADAS